MNFGELTSETVSFEIMDTALEAGINFFDTADVYGGPQSPDMEKGFGTSEQIIGRWLAQGGRRDRIILATKLYQPMGAGPNDRGLSAYHIRRACEDSLRRLQTDHINLYQMHHVDRRTPWDEIWQAMGQLVREGKVTYVGSSNFAGWDIATAQSVAASRNFLGLASEQSLYNLSARTVELEVIPALRYYGIVKVIPRDSKETLSNTVEEGDSAMPHVIVKLWPGKSEQQQKQRLAEAITKDVMDILHYGDESVSVAMEEIKSRDWAENVYKPDIQNKWETLYKKPGYDVNLGERGKYLWRST
jgi:aryl-alcohol dehydrogenase-like predicted oxidoreductase